MALSIPIPGADNPKIINPRCALRIFGTEDILLEEQEIDIEDISKDLDEEPNEATVTIYNLDEDTRNRIIDPSSKDTPIEIFFAPFGTTDLITAFVGNIDRAETTETLPGHSTRLECSSQKWNHQSTYLDGKTYSKGTPIATVIKDLTDAINLPVVGDDGIPPGALLLARTFTGPAFTLLQHFVYDYGRFCFILDGKIHISSVYTPVNPTVTKITESMMITKPQPTERADAIDVEIKTVVESNGTDPLAKLTRKEKEAIRKRARVKKMSPDQISKKLASARTAGSVTLEPPGGGDYVEVTAIDQIIHGLQVDLFGLPTIDPDHIVTVEGFGSNLFRVQEVHHFGSNAGEGAGFTTRILVDEYSGAAPIWSAF